MNSKDIFATLFEMVWEVFSKRRKVIEIDNEGCLDLSNIKNIKFEVTKTSDKATN